MALAHMPRPPAPELLEGGLDAGVEDGVGPAVEGEAPLERGDAEPALPVGHEERHGAAAARVAKRVRLAHARDSVAVAAAAVEGGLRLLLRERAHPDAHFISQASDATQVSPYRLHVQAPLPLKHIHS